MQKTANYQLSQFDAADRVTREAINADNRIVDAALAASNCRVVTGTVTTEFRSGIISLQLGAKPVLLVLYPAGSYQNGCCGAIFYVRGAETYDSASVPDISSGSVYWNEASGTLTLPPGSPPASSAWFPTLAYTALLEK